MRRNLIETAMGAFVLAAAAAFLLIVYKSSNTPSVSGYQMAAEFNKIGGLKVGRIPFPDHIVFEQDLTLK